MVLYPNELKSLNVVKVYYYVMTTLINLPKGFTSTSILSFTFLTIIPIHASTDYLLLPFQYIKNPRPLSLRSRPECKTWLSFHCSHLAVYIYDNFYK